MLRMNMIAVTEYTGEFLVLHRVRRKDMGAFFCIAKNSVPPSVSKRIMLNVNCKYYFNEILVYICLNRFYELQGRNN